MLELLLSCLLNDSAITSVIPKKYSQYDVGPRTPKLIQPTMNLDHLQIKDSAKNTYNLHLHNHKIPEYYIFRTKINKLHIIIRQKLPQESTNYTCNINFRK